MLLSRFEMWGPADARGLISCDLSTKHCYSEILIPVIFSNLDSCLSSTGLYLSVTMIHGAVVLFIYLSCQFQDAQAQVEEASKMRRRLNGEVLKASGTTTVPVDSNAKAGQTPKRTAAAIAAEVAEKLAASSSSQMIMHAVLSTFAAEEAKNAPKPETSLPVSDPNVFMLAQPLTAPTTHSYQSVLFTQPTMQNQTPTTQSQFHILPNPSSQPYIQPGGGIATPYAYGNFSVLPPGPPLPPPYKVSQTVPLAQQPSQMPQQQPLPVAQQEAPINQKQPRSLTQQTLGANFRPQPPGLEYYGHPSHS